MCVLKKEYKITGSKYGGIKHNKPYIIGFKIPYDEEDLGDSDIL